MPPTRVADLEIGIHRRDQESYSVDLRYVSATSDDTDVRLPTSALRLDLDDLRSATDTREYGEKLAAALLGDPERKLALAQAQAAASTADASLRIRLLIGPSARELHAVKWETLRDPQTHQPMLTGENLLFSRYLSSVDWRPLKPRADLRAFVFVADPQNAGDYQQGGQALARVDVAGEVARAKAALGTRPVSTLAAGQRATLNALLAHLRSGVDILYLVCHGALVKGEPHLWLEDDDGRAAVTAGATLVARMAELRDRPRLVVLASCQSAGTGDDTRTGDDGALSALGPRLAEAGVPAVVAMQGNVAMDTVAAFMPVFFTELQRDGLVDRAMAVARGAVREREDWWLPTLYMRLRSGRIWYVPGFGDDPKAFEKWPTLLGNIRDGNATPFLGPGLHESLTGSTFKTARALAEKYRFPLADHDRDNLAQVSQYLAVNQSQAVLQQGVTQLQWREVINQCGEQLPADLRGVQPDDLPTDELLTGFDTLLEAGRLLRTATDGEPHALLAQVPFRIYLTTTPDSLLANALVAEGRDPQVAVCAWNDHMARPESVFERETAYRPDAKRPLVYQLFGRLADADSLVLTEDDYFDYLIGFTSQKDLIPPVVRRALADTALLFLGFRMDDWQFRVLFRTVMSQAGGSRRSRYAHVAVQIDPDESRISEPEAARRYFESYFGDADIVIYWGSAEDFLRELAGQWQARSAANAAPSPTRG